MNAQKGDRLFTRPAIVAGVTLVHLAVGAALLMLPAPVVPPSGVTAIDVQFAETALPPPPPLERDPAPIIEPPSPQPIPSNSFAADPDSPLIAASNEPEILMQNQADRAPAQLPEPSSQRPASGLDQAQIAAVLNQITCSRLTRQRHEDCPKTNPFDVAEAVAARAAPEDMVSLARPDLPMSAMEQFLAKQDGPGHMFPGMDADMFADTMAPGAYDAARIRDGDAPRWSDKMKRGFTRTSD